MEYTKKEDFRRLVKASAALQGIQLAQVADNMQISKQQLSNMFNKAYPTIEDARRIAAAMNCKLIIDFMPRGSAAEDQE